MKTEYSMTESQLMTLSKLHPENYAPREIAYLTDKDKYVFWDGEKWMDFPEGEAEEHGFAMNLYDLNKNIVSQLPVLTDYTDAKILLDNFNHNKIYMLLCKEISYYTIFQYDDACKNTKFSDVVLECANDIGQIISVDLTEDKNAIEIWVRTDDDNLCMYLFNSEQMFVYYGG